MHEKPFWKRRRNDLYCVIIATLIFLVRVLPRRVGLAFVSLLGRLIFHVFARDRKRAIEGLRFIYGKEKGEVWVQRTARAVFKNIAMNFYDAAFLIMSSKERFDSIVKVEGLDKLRKATEETGCGCIVISGHLGCFEIMTHAAARNGVKCTTVGQKLYDPRIDKMVTKMRSADGNIVYLHRDGSARDIVRHLRSGWQFGVLIDQDTRVESVFVPFLGVPAKTPSAPIRMAMSFKIPVVVSWTARQPDGSHIVNYSDPIKMQDTGDSEADLVANVATVMKQFCEALEKYPDQWVWMHERWKTRPEGQ